MATTTPNLSLTVTPASDTIKTFRQFRNELASDDSTSNMMKIDTAIGDIQTGKVSVSQGVGNAGKVLGVNSSGNVAAVEAPSGVVVSDTAPTNHDSLWIDTSDSSPEFEIDDTLTTSGSGADAKVVGDALNSLKFQVVSDTDGAVVLGISVTI